MNEIALSLARVHWILISVGVFSFICGAFFLKGYFGSNHKSWKSALPIAKQIEGNTTQTIMDARDQYPDSPFILEKAQKWIILPHALVDEVKRIPEHQASFLRTNYERFLGRYTGIGTFTPDEGIVALRNDLARNIDKVLDDLQDEAAYALDKEIGDCDTWTEATLYRNVLGIIARLSARTFVGMPLCRDEPWIAATKSLSTDIIITMYTIKWFRPWVRPFVTPFLSQYRNLIWYNFYISSTLKPQVTAIVDTYKKTNSTSRDAILAKDNPHEKVTKENQNLVYWTIGNFKYPARAGVVEIGHQFYVITFAAIHTMSAALTHVLFDIATHPEYAEILREEIDDVVAEENHPQGRLLTTSIPKLKKLDSFIKESQRVSPMTMINMPRAILAKEGITLSTGLKLPYGCFIGFGTPFHPNSTTPKGTIITAENQPPLSEFSPWRYSDLRKIPGEENKHQVVSADNNDLTFGAGVHACPGRFFAANEIKIAVVEILKRYDIALGPQGQAQGEDGYVRPQIMEHDTWYSPDFTAKVYFRSRQQ